MQEQMLFSNSISCNSPKLCCFLVGPGENWAVEFPSPMRMSWHQLEEGIPQVIPHQDESSCWRDRERWVSCPNWGYHCPSEICCKIYFVSNKNLAMQEKMLFSNLISYNLPKLCCVLVGPGESRAVEFPSPMTSVQEGIPSVIPHQDQTSRLRDWERWVPSPKWGVIYLLLKANLIFSLTDKVALASNAKQN